MASLDDKYGGENAGALRRWANWIKKTGKAINQFGFIIPFAKSIANGFTSLFGDAAIKASDGFGTLSDSALREVADSAGLEVAADATSDQIKNALTDASPEIQSAFTESLPDFAGITDGSFFDTALFDWAGASATADALSKLTGIGFVLGILQAAAGSIFTFVGNVMIGADNLIKGQYNKAIKEAVAGTVETGIEASYGLGAAFLNMPGISWVPWALNLPSLIGTGKYVSTHAYEATMDAMDHVVGKDETQGSFMERNFPGLSMQSLRAQPAALAMTPAMAAIPAYAAPQPAPGYGPTHWQQRRADELGMGLDQLQQQRGMTDLQQARAARAEQLALEESRA